AASPIPSTNTAAISHSDQFDPKTVNNSASVSIAPTNIHDFNGDGKSEVLWYNNTSGQTVAWLVNGTSGIGGGSPGTAPSPWAIVGQRDFNGDGRSDILWRNGTSGQLAVWLLNGTSVIGGGSPGTAASPWLLAGTGDFHRCAISDVLL